MSWRVRKGAAAVTIGAAAALAAGAAPALAAPALTTASAQAAIAVPCSVSALNAAISAAPSGAFLSLARHCTYRPSAPLTTVTGSLTILGNGDTVDFTGTGTILTVTGTLAVTKLTFTGGDATTGSQSGAIYDDGGAVSLTDDTFRDNTGVYGGALGTTGSAVLTAADCDFSANTATVYGGAIASEGGTTTIAGGNFYGNSSSYVDGEGGAIYNEATLVVTASASGQKTQFTGNHVDYYGGAIGANDDGTTTVSGTTFTDNTAGDYGGAIATEDDLTLTDSGLTDGQADYGGAVYAYEDTLSVVNDSVSGNQADFGGGFYLDYAAAAHLASSTGVFLNQASDDGGGVFIACDGGPLTRTSGAFVRDNRPDNVAFGTCDG
jgi:predicted outer membrane repeat protein